MGAIGAVIIGLFILALCLTVFKLLDLVGGWRSLRRSVGYKI
jgi:hypothetical protein